MKKMYLLTALALAYAAAQAQQTSFGGMEAVGTTAGTLGNTASNSYFGHEAGLVNTGANNTFTGYRSGFSNTTGDYNTANGTQALYSNTTGDHNTANGAQALYSNTIGNYNTANGTQALYSATTGGGNTATGYAALYNTSTGAGNTANGFSALYSNTTGNYNTANGMDALHSNTEGWCNTAIGRAALSNNTTAWHNTAIGYLALERNTTGSGNTANGDLALNNNTTASQNTAIGMYALYAQSFSNGNVVWNSDNVAVGFEALYSNQPTANTNGYRNTAIGVKALRSNTTGWFNTATGYAALHNTTTGNYNTTTGYATLYNNTNGVDNTANGSYALYSNTNGANNTANGNYALFNNTTGSNNTAVGYNSGPNAGNYSNTTALGNSATTTASNQIRIGNNAITSIGGFANWSNVSDARFKKEIKEDVAGLAFIEKLRPVSYELDRQKLDTFLRGEDAEPFADLSPAERAIGFIAQEVEQIVNENRYVFSGVDKPQNERSHYGLRYAEFVVPLVKAVQELSTKNKAQQELIGSLQQLVASQQVELETLKSVVYGSPFKINTGGKTDAESEPQSLPESFALYQNVPNPFDKSTVIAAQLPESVQQAKIVVYNLQGLELASYPLDERGKVFVEISGGRFPAGMYLYALLADGRVMSTKKMILTN